MKVLFSFLLVVSTAVECGNWFVPTGADGPPPAYPQPGQVLSPESDKKEWKVGELGKKSKKELLQYFSAYGYTGTYTDQATNLVEGLKDFQFFAGIPTTGVLDAATVKMINTERCGQKDPNPQQKRREFEKKNKSGRSGRYRRYNHQGTVWKKELLTWQYIHNPFQLSGIKTQNKFSENQVRNIMKTAMRKWEAASNIVFKEDRRPFTVGGANEPDVLVRFVSSDTSNHDKMDPFPFDGRGGTLAHAFYPMYNRGLAGDVHFDDEENWTIKEPGFVGRYQEFDLNWVATHELGHTLGLEHSHEGEAVMYPFYKGYVKDMQLTYDDRVGIQTLYGGKRKTEKKLKICPPSATSTTAIWNHEHADGTNTYLVATQDKKLHHINKDGSGLKTDQSIPQSTYYNNIHDNIEAVYQTNLGKESNPMYTVIFTRRGYYVYDGVTRKSGPHNYLGGNNYVENTFCQTTDTNDERPLRLNFPSYVRKLDAVMKWRRNNKVYFFTGQMYWRFDEKKQMFDCGYPRLIQAVWRGIPGNIDAAYSSSKDGKTFFIKEKDIFYFDDEKVKVKGTKDIRTDFLRCTEDK